LHNHNKKLGLIAIGIVILAGLAINGPHIFDSRPKSSNDTAVLGASISNKNVDFKVNSFNIYPTTETTQVKRVSINVTITNKSTEDLQISPGLQMELIDSTGTVHPYTADYLPTGYIAGGPLRSGETWVQSVDFNLSADQKPTTFVYQPDASSGVIKVGL